MKRAMVMLALIALMGPTAAIGGAVKENAEGTEGTKTNETYRITKDRALQQALLHEGADFDLEAAIRSYEKIVKRFDRQRDSVAYALFRLGECYRKLGETEKAEAQYRRVITDFPEQRELVSLSRKQLKEMGATLEKETEVSSVAVAEQKKLVRRQLELAKRAVKRAQRRVEAGRGNRTDLIEPKRRVLSLKQELAALDGDRKRQRELIQEEIALVEEKLKRMKKQTEVAQVSPHAAEEIQQEILELKRALVATYDEAEAKYDPGSAKEAAMLKEAKGLAQVGKDRLSLLNEENQTLLHEAAQKGYLAVTRFLIDRGALIDRQDGDKRTALHYAVANGYTAIAEQLIDAGANVNAGTRKGATPLHYAAGNGHRHTVELLIDNGADLGNKTSRKWEASPPGSSLPRFINRQELEPGITPLHIAAKQGFEKVVKNLIDQGAAVNARSQLGRTPLFVAVEEGEVAAVRQLLERGADPDVATTFAEGKRTPLHAAAYSQEMTRLLLEHGVDPNAQDRWGVTPLVKAARISDRLDVLPQVKLLLEKGADPNIKPKDRKPALHVAVSEGSLGLIEALLELGAKVDLKDDQGYTALERAILTTKYDGVAEILLEGGADPNVRGRMERTPLHWAIMGRDVAGRNIDVDEGLISLLLKHDANPNLQTARGMTALHLALSEVKNRLKTERFVKTLIRHGADPSIKDDNGRRPSELAPPAIDSEVRKLLDPSPNRKSESEED